MTDLYLSVRIFSYPVSERPKAAFQIMLGLHHFVDSDMLYADGDKPVDLRHKSQHLCPCIAPVFSCHHSISRHGWGSENGIVIFEHLRFLPYWWTLPEVSAKRTIRQTIKVNNNNTLSHIQLSADIAWKVLPCAEGWKNFTRVDFWMGKSVVHGDQWQKSFLKFLDFIKCI